MIAVELIRRSRSADAIGPFGSKTPPEQPPSAVAPTRARASTAYRISDLVCPATIARIAMAARSGPRWSDGHRERHDPSLMQGKQVSALRYWTMVTVLTCYAGPP